MPPKRVTVVYTGRKHIDRVTSHRRDCVAFYPHQYDAAIKFTSNTAAPDHVRKVRQQQIG